MDKSVSCTALTAKADIVKDYIGWAAGKNYAVIDVNIPKNVTVEPVSRTPADSQPLIWQSAVSYERVDPGQPTHTEELAEYLWDNYIE